MTGGAFVPTPIVIETLDAAIFARLVEQAARNGRSLPDEVRAILKTSLEARAQPAGGKAGVLRTDREEW